MKQTKMSKNTPHDGTEGRRVSDRNQGDDLFYTIFFKGTEQFALVEHQSSVDYKMAFRMNEYSGQILNAMKRDLSIEDKKRWENLYSQ